MKIPQHHVFLKPPTEKITYLALIFPRLPAGSFYAGKTTTSGFPQMHYIFGDLKTYIYHNYFHDYARYEYYARKKRPNIMLQ